MKSILLSIVVLVLYGHYVRADETDLLLGVWQPVEVWADGMKQKPERSHFKLYVNERKQWGFGDWPDYPDFSDALIAGETYKPSSLPKGTLVLPNHFGIWSLIDQEHKIMTLSLLRPDGCSEQRTIKKYALRDDQLFVLHVSSTLQNAKRWWGFAERHGDLGGGFFVGKFPAAGPKELSEKDTALLAAIDVPAEPADTAAIAESMPKLESSGRTIIPRPRVEVVVYERAPGNEPKAQKHR